MVNSPGPSSSKTIQMETSAKVNFENSDKKKKRTRRKPRSKAKKEDVSKAQTEPQPPAEALLYSIEFKIKPVTVPTCTFFKQRDQAFGHINLKSFLKNRQFSSEEIAKRVQQLTILNGIRSVPSTSRSYKNRNEKKAKKKEPVLFPDYITAEEVAIGLENGQLIKGNIRINPKNYKESYVGNEDISKADYIITSVLDRNRAMEGDEVILRIKTANKDQKKIAEVVHITKMIHPRSAVGFLKLMDNNEEFAVLTPRDKRIPQIKIPKISWPSGFKSNQKLYQEILFMVKISEWKEVNYALGTITENLGLNGDLKVESLAILRELCLDPTPFGNDIKQFLPKSSTIPPEEFTRREDIRKECVFTIDPMTARDLDDAVSCCELPDGNFEVGVHISDVSYYLEEDTLLDDLVKNKATTIYMVDNVYHMLPIEMCLHCSLLPGTDKLAFSVFWEMTPTGEILNKRLTRTVINSCAQLAYEHAQMMIDQSDASLELPPIHNGFTRQDLSKVVNSLHTIAVNLRKKRENNGSLKIDQVKISFSLDPKTGEPLDLWICDNKPSHRLIEEFMLLANMTVAAWIYEAYPDLAFLRMHEAPKPTMMVELQKNLETVGIHIDISSSGSIQASLNKYADEDFLAQSRMVVLNHLLAKPMKRAKYFCAGALEKDTEFKHFALSIPIYTHFTSPIRRYADVMTHRLLAASLNYCDKPNLTPEEVAAVAETCNRQKYHAKKAGEASCDLYLAHYIEAHQPYIQQGVVVDTKERSIDVIILNTGSVVRIYTNNFGRGVEVKSEEIPMQQNEICSDVNVKKMWRMFVKFPKTAKEPGQEVVLEIFSLVRVELMRKPKTNKFEAKLLRPLNNLI